MVKSRREMMNQALKKVMIPYLRQKGFKGSFPHFRRMTEINIELITFQFNKWGGSFVVELAASPIQGVTMTWGEQIPPNKVTAHDINERYRLGAKSGDGIWFDFENAENEQDYEKVASHVLDLLMITDISQVTQSLNKW